MHEDAEARPSTVAEHEHLANRDHADTNAPGRSEGSREHSSLATPRDATCATASAASRRQPEAYVASLSPDLPDASQHAMRFVSLSKKPASTPVRPSKKLAST
jgi:hypothetical protein